jgi:hypothetical protein
VRCHLLVTVVAAQDTPGFLGAMEWVAPALVHAPLFAARPLAVAASAAAAAGGIRLMGSDDGQAWMMGA